MVFKSAFLRIKLVLFTSCNNTTTYENNHTNIWELSCNFSNAESPKPTGIMKYLFKEISTSELSDFINLNRGIIIDVRSIDAYNGWKLGNEIRGGHIPGAKSLPSKWATYIDWIEIVRSKKSPQIKRLLYMAILISTLRK